MKGILIFLVDAKRLCFGISAVEACESCPKGRCFFVGYSDDGNRKIECSASSNLSKMDYVGFAPSAAGVVLTAGVFLLVLGSFWLYKTIKKRRMIKLKKQFFERNGGMLLQQQVSSDEGGIERTKIFPSEELEKATDKFNQNLINGRGGQGTVYKGILTDGRLAEIKNHQRGGYSFTNQP